MSNSNTIPCIVYKRTNSSVKMVSFFAEAGDIIRWCGVYRKSISQEGYQRTLKTPHYDGIRKYLEANNTNVIPNSLVIAFNDSLEIDGVTDQGASLEDENLIHPVDDQGIIDTETLIGTARLKLRIHPKCATYVGGDDANEREQALSDYRSAYVIDGQHRIHGGNATSRNVYFPVTAFLGVDKEEQAFQFIVINYKAKKVSKHDIDAVIPRQIYDQLQNRLIDANIVNSDADIVYGLDNSEGSPFQGKIAWTNNESDEAVIGKGAIDKIIRLVGEVPEDVSDEFENKLELLIEIWKGVMQHLSPIADSKQYEHNGSTYDNQLIIKGNAVLPAVQMAINQAIGIGAIRLDDDVSLETSTYNWIKGIPLEFFYCQWKLTSITNDDRMRSLSNLILDSIRTKKVPYETKDGKIWFDEPFSREQKEAAKKAKKKGKKTK